MLQRVLDPSLASPNFICAASPFPEPRLPHFPAFNLSKENGWRIFGGGRGAGIAPAIFFQLISLINPGSDDESAQFPLMTPGRHLLTPCFGGMELLEEVETLLDASHKNQLIFLSHILGFLGGSAP